MIDKIEAQMTFGATKQLEALTALAGIGRGVPVTDELRRALLAHRWHRDKMCLIIDELWRRYSYMADPIGGEMFGMPRVDDATVDVEGACLFVAVLAQGFGIRCRFTMARYDRASWTVFVAYENEEGLWMNLNVLRQKTDKVPNELVMGPIIGEKS